MSHCGKSRAYALTAAHCMTVIVDSAAGRRHGDELYRLAPTDTTAALQYGLTASQAQPSAAVTMKYRTMS